MQNRISIAMATFNGEAFIGEQLESFLAQTAMPDELVISDDGSIDSTVSVTKTCMDGSSVELLLKQNSHTLGYAQNFNTALRLASGDIIFLSDQDDVWLENKIKIVKKAFEANPEKYLIIHDLEYCDENLQPIGQTKLERLNSIGATERSFVTGMATAVRKEFLNVCLPIPKNALITHDLWLHECAHVLNVKIVLPEVLALYRRHDLNVTADSVINSGKKTNFFSFIKSVDGKETKNSLERKGAVLRELMLWFQRADVIRFCQKITSMKQSSLSKKRRTLEHELAQTEKRLKLYDKNRPIRLFAAIKLYLEGGYVEFMGVKSLIKDILAKV
ncbi:glycosyltransferase family 2 protein [Methylophaga sp.]|uniref:glycosyltransferase family 2 protein n=1 Tax=Methylophaga sp. TaxID=2024840 RepID=UPI0014015410|nr:glycosyltransferase family 2 protein [Methylophaga sp.]MTI64685.1 glycosyltransferase family 2 protein [Methylophaga sp.]